MANKHITTKTVLLVYLLSLSAILFPGILSAEENVTEYTTIPSRYDRYELFRRQIAAIADRDENRPGAHAMLNFLVDYARDRNIDWQLYDIEQRGEFHSFGKNLSFFIPGREENRFVLFVPYINTMERSNTAVIAALLSILEGLNPRSYIEICFLGSVDENKGLREYLSRTGVLSQDALFYLTGYDSLGNIIQQEHGDRGNVTPLGLVRYIEDLLAAEGFPRGLRNTQLYRIGLSSPNNIATLLEAELSATGLVFLPPPRDPLSGRASLKFLSELIQNSGTELVTQTIEQGEQHYTHITIGELLLFVTENQYVIGLLASLLFFTLCFLIIRRKQRRLPGIGLNGIILLFFFCAAMLISLFLGDLMTSLVGIIRNVEDLSRYASPSLLLLKATSTLVCFAVLENLIRRSFSIQFPFADKDRFYSIMAIVTLVLNLVIFTIININFSHYFLWALLWALVFSVSPNRRFKIFCLLLAPLLLILTFTAATEDLRARLINPEVSINLMITCIVLPFAFLIIGFRRKKTAPTARSSTVRVLLPLSLTFLIAFEAVPFSADNPQQIVISASSSRRVPFSYSDQTSALLNEEGGEKLYPFDITASSNASLGSFTINFLDFVFRADTPGKIYEFPNQDLPAELDYSVKRQTFLGRSSYMIELSSKVNSPRRISIDLYTGEDSPIYNANLPYTSLTGLGRIQFLTGINPPNPLVIEFILPANIEPRLEVEALYHIRDNYFLIPGDDKNFTLLNRERVIFDSEYQLQDPDNADL